ncbi:MAG: transglutaminase-like domain-containing protein [Thermodesulfobacteriota bacterium]
MKTPPLLLAAALVFWGWQTGLLAFGLIMALIVEGSRLIGRRFEFTLAEYSRIADLCGLIFLAMLVYRYAADAESAARWLPLALFLLVAAQAYGSSPGIPLGAVFWTYRRKAKAETVVKTFDASYPYLALCLLAAAAANVRTVHFYLGLFVIAAWALWPFRSKRRLVVTWMMLLAVAGILGYVGQIWLHQLHLWVEGKALDWIESGMRDPYQNATAIGEIGDLKLSDRIEFRVEPEPGQVQPLLLHEASYDTYRAGRWLVSAPGFKLVDMKPDGTTWTLEPGRAKRNIRVLAPLSRGQGLLKLPAGAWQIENLPAQRLTRNLFGAVKVEEGPGLAMYLVRYEPGTSSDSPPSAKDLLLPQSERSAVTETAGRLKLSERPPDEALKAVTEYFDRNFKYSLILSDSDRSGGTLADFLLRTKTGHCEYFATAAVLLLRSAGIPARYATGYLATEYSPREGRFLVRARHAHAWALAYVDGVWRDLDATPPSWVRLENQAAPLWTPLADAWSWIGFKLSQWRWGERPEWLKYAWLLLIPAILILARGLWSKRPTARPREDLTARSETPAWPGLDSAFFLIEKRISEAGWPRQPEETLSQWLARLEKTLDTKASLEPLRDLLILHNRLRFDPQGLDPEQKMILSVQVQNWLGQYDSSFI